MFPLLACLLCMLGLAPAARSQAATLTISLYEARAPGDARPFGPVLGSVTINTSTLPPTTFVSGPPPALQQAAVPSAQIAVNLSSMNALIKPGKAYTLVLSVSGSETVFVRSMASGASSGSGVAFKASGGSLVPQAALVAAHIESHCTWTQTTAHDVTRRVTMHLELDDGREITGSAVVAGQVAIENEWLGTAPGELPALQLEDP